MPIPRMRGPYGGPSLNTLELVLELELKQYMKQLTVIHETIYAQERAREEENPERQHQLKPRDLVYVRKFRRRWNEQRREGPFRITTTSPTALLVEGSTVWYHLNHCTRAIDNRSDGQGGSDDEPEPNAKIFVQQSGDPTDAASDYCSHQHRKSLLWTCLTCLTCLTWKQGSLFLRQRISMLISVHRF